MPRLMVTGASGYLGGELARQALATGWTVTGVFHSTPGDVREVDWHRADVRDRREIEKLLATARPHAVAHTATGRSQDDWVTVADGAAHVALAAATVGARLVHVSSDAIFSGRHAPYDESALPDPVTRYGAAKAAAETAVLAIAPAAVVARTSLIVGDGQPQRRSKHERHVLDLVAGRVAGVLFTDEVRCPVHVADLAGALLELAGSAFSGVINVAGSEALSRHQLGLLIARRHGCDPAAARAGRSADLGVPRPMDTRLDISLAQRLLATRLRGASDYLSV